MAGADCDLVGAGAAVSVVDDFEGVGAAEAAAAIGAEEEEMALVPRSINLGWADLPEKKSDADRAGSAE